jgi:hypothetical protein
MTIHSTKSTVLHLGVTFLAFLTTIVTPGMFLRGSLSGNPLTLKPLYVPPSMVLRILPSHSSTLDASPCNSSTFNTNCCGIDGVLLLGDEPLPGATETLLFLQNNSIPFVLLTNGGGKTEAARVAHLTEKLKVPLTVENFVQSHTPFKELAKGTFNNIGPLENKTVLVSGLFPDKI